MNFQRLNDELAVALTWLTRLPVQFPANAPTLAQSAWAFPIVGLMLGAASAATFVILQSIGAPDLLAAVLAIATLTVLTGGLHEDGLADFFDGLGARGGKSGKLAAMRDSNIGTYGVLALVISFGVRTGALASVDHAIALIAVCALSRTAMVLAMRNMTPARTDGAGHKAGRPEDLAQKAAMGIATGLLILWVLIGGAIVGAILIALAAALSFLWIRNRAENAYGGYTGDVLGALCLLSETAMLAAIAVWLA
jgi:adenosylcobinamide-GDP ribazoletransferase